MLLQVYLHKYNIIEIDKNVSSLLDVVGKSYENLLPGPAFKCALSSASMDSPWCTEKSFFISYFLTEIISMVTIKKKKALKVWEVDHFKI